jgi:hypothetical protein
MRTVRFGGTTLMIIVGVALDTVTDRGALISKTTKGLTWPGAGASARGSFRS